MRHTFVALVENKPAALMRICSLFQRTNINICSLNVGACELPTLSRMTVIFDTDAERASLLKRQFRRLINVIEIHHLENDRTVERRSNLIRVKASQQTLPDLVELAGRFNAGIADLSPDSLMFELTGPEDHVQTAVLEFEKFGIHEVVFGGIVSMLRGAVSAGSQRATYYFCRRN
jgi:acetolactate synthase-1/3 small subunit